MKISHLVMKKFFFPVKTFFDVENFFSLIFFKADREEEDVCDVEHVICAHAGSFCL